VELDSNLINPNAVTNLVIRGVTSG